ncbi:MAG: hypothetical protein IT440_11330 [Phycisphaeraceae bacterium]|nr:hypothetical protein [Phycisphaeraceae bacterium]
MGKATGDSKDQIPPWLREVNYTTEWVNGWVHMLLPYTNYHGSLWVCPSAPQSQYANLLNTGDDCRTGTSSHDLSEYMTIGINVGHQYAFYYEFAKLYQIRNQATLIYAADCSGRWTNGNPLLPMNPYVYPDHPMSLYPRHLEAINILFIDGHATANPSDNVRAWANNCWSESPAYSHFFIH